MSSSSDDSVLSSSVRFVSLGDELLVERLGLPLGAGVDVGELLREVRADRGLLAHDALLEALESGLDGAHLTAEEDVADLVEAFRCRLVRRDVGGYGAGRGRGRGGLSAVFGAVVLGTGHGSATSRRGESNRLRQTCRSGQATAASRSGK